MVSLKHFIEQLECGDDGLFGYFVGHVECASKIPALDIYYDDDVGDADKGLVEVALGEVGVELKSYRWSI